MTRPNVPRKKKGMIGWLVSQVIQIILILVFIDVATIQAPRLDLFLDKHKEDVVHAAESTAAYFALTPAVYPTAIKIHLDPAFVKSLGANGLTGPIPEVVAAAMSESIKPADLLGFVEVESSMCANPGTATAIDEATKRLAQAEEKDKGWWQGNIDALNAIAKDLGMNVRDIRGSEKAGAISCLQVMPINWVAFGGKDYRDTYQAAVVASRYLNANGYQTDPKRAFGSYNPNAGQPYVNSVVAAASRWKERLSGIEFDGKTTSYVEIDTAKKPKPSLLSVATIYMEFLAKYVNGGDQIVTLADIPNIGSLKMIQPYPGSYPVAYQFGDKVYSDAGVYLGQHTGSDRVNPNGGPVVAAHDGGVTMVKNLDAWNDALSVQLWTSGISVVVQGKLDDGTQVCSIYGHGEEGSVKVVPGQKVTAGQELFTAGCTGFCRGRHLHFGVIVGGSGPLCEGGKWIDPETLLQMQDKKK